MKILAAKLLKEKRQKAAEMIGQPLAVQVSAKALSIDKDKHTAIFVMSTVNVDRHGDVVDQESWILDHFMKNPAFFLQHRSGEFPIGKWLRVWLEADPDNVGEQRLVGEAEFRVKYDDAARAFDHVMEGDMNMVSVGFIPHRVEYDEHKDVFILYDCELMECSLVGIGSNRQALIKAEETPVDPIETKKEVRDNLISNKEVLEALAKADADKVISSQLKALSLVNKAIRQLEK